MELRQEVGSGKNISERPGMQEILNDIKSGNCQAIIVQNIARLSRDPDGIDGQLIKRICRKYNCIITPIISFSYEFNEDFIALLEEGSRKRHSSNTLLTII